MTLQYTKCIWLYIYIYNIFFITKNGSINIDIIQTYIPVLMYYNVITGETIYYSTKLKTMNSNLGSRTSALTYFFPNKNVILQT